MSDDVTEDDFISAPTGCIWDFSPSVHEPRRRQGNQRNRRMIYLYADEKPTAFVELETVTSAKFYAVHMTL